MSLKLRKVNAEVRDPESEEMIPAGLLGSDALSTIEQAKDDAIEAVEDKGAETLASIPDDYSTLSGSVGELKTQLIDLNDTFSNGKITVPFVSGYWSTSNGAIQPDTSSLIGTAKMQVVPGNIISADHEANLYVLKYDKTGAYLGYNSNSNSFTVPDGVYYIAWDFPTTTDVDVDFTINTQITSKIEEIKSEADQTAGIVDDITEEYKSKNLFDGQYSDGYRNNANIAGTDSNYAHTKPIWLTAGNYLFPSSESQFGTTNGRRAFITDANGVCSSYILGSVVGTKTEAGKYNNRNIIGFTLQNDSYVSFNIGSQTATNPASIQVNNFMVVAGSSITDFPNYEEYYAPYYGIASTLPPTQSVNGLSGLFYKTAIFDGDSICNGTSVGDDDPTKGYGWAGRVGKANFMQWHNYGINGGVIVSADNASASGKHSVVDNIDTMHSDYPDADYVVFEGGTNDADLGIDMGTFSDTDFSGTYDTTTFCGALETIFYKATNYWKGKSIGYIVAQRMGTGTGPNSSYAHRKTYFDKAIEICQKWGVPYLNLWDNCYLDAHNPNCYNSDLTNQQNIEQGYLYVDGQHLTAKGYDYISPIIENWMKSI